jgi:hypothetical protein
MGPEREFISIALESGHKYQKERKKRSQKSKIITKRSTIAIL